jgi:uncharacterized protein (UPF0332 family)
MTAGRTAYFAGFHAAQALISHHTNRSVKTHRGVSAELHRLVQNDVASTRSCGLSLGAATSSRRSRITRPVPHVTPEQAQAAITGARRFVAAIAGIVDGRP